LFDGTSTLLLPFYVLQRFAGIRASFPDRLWVAELGPATALPPLDGRASTLAGAEVLELRQIERTLKLKMEPLLSDTACGEHLVAGTEVLPPGATLPKHRHLVQDEIVLIHSGTAHVWLGDQERDLHAGGLVFIPANTWITAKNIGNEPTSLTFVFSAPGFEDTMRCNSVPAGETPTPITPEQQKECAHLGHAESASRSEDAKK
jgi:quercetin dioxygenase-like cupin family protein